jgi:hypothetical protein
MLSVCGLFGAGRLRLLVVVVVAVFFSFGVVMAADTWSPAPAEAAPVVVAAAPADAAHAPAPVKEEFLGSGGLTFKQRRDMGLTIGGVAKAVKELKAEGLIEKGMSKSEVSAMVMERLAEQNPRAYENDGMDWDQILDFIERLMSLIMKLMDLFN